MLTNRREREKKRRKVRESEGGREAEREREGRTILPAAVEEGEAYKCTVGSKSNSSLLLSRQKRKAGVHHGSAPPLKCTYSSL